MNGKSCQVLSANEKKCFKTLNAFERERYINEDRFFEEQRAGVFVIDTRIDKKRQKSVVTHKKVKEILLDENEEDTEYDLCTQKLKDSI